MPDIVKAIQAEVSKLEDISLGDVISTSFTATASSSNEVTSTEVELSLAMGERILCSHLKSIVEKRYDNAKKVIDDCLDKLGLSNISILPGTRQQLHEDNLFLFQKVVKRPAIRVDTTKLRIAMVREGINDEVIDRIFKAAEAESQPQVVYEVIPKV